MRLGHKIKSYSSGIFLSLIVSVNDTNIIETLKSKNLKYLELENNAQQSLLIYEKYDSLYAPYLLLDGSQEKDRLDTLTMPSGTLTDRTQITASLNKNFTTGTLLGVSTTYFHSETPALQPNLSGDYYQNYFSVNLEQSIWPNFFGRNTNALRQSYLQNYNLLKNMIEQQKTDEIKNQLDLYWRIKVLTIEKDKNLELQRYYETLASKTKQKKSNGLTNPGEYEQVVAENILRKQLIAQDEVDLLKAQNDLLVSLNAPDATLKVDTSIDLKNIPAYNFKTFDIKNSKLYQIQKAKVDFADSDYQAASNNAWPNISLYGKYTQQGLENSQSSSWDEMSNEGKNKYLIGLKMNYTFDQKTQALERDVKRRTYEIEKNRMNQIEKNLSLQFNDLKNNINMAYKKIQDYITVVNLRKNIIQQLRNSYQQGRIDISVFIEANNKYVQSEVQLAQLISQYQQLIFQYENLELN